MGRREATILKPLQRFTQKPHPMNQSLALLVPAAAAGWSLLYLLFGGGLFGAIVIFIIAKIFRK
jgi:hypothetical protein